MSELGIKGSVEKIVKKALNPNENLLTNSDTTLTPGHRALNENSIEVKVDLETLKTLAKNYFYSIGDVEMANAVDSVDPEIRSKAFNEVSEKCPEIGRLIQEHDEKLIKKLDEKIDKIEKRLKEKGYMS